MDGLNHNSDSDPLIRRSNLLSSVFVLKLGRGRTGGSTGLDWIIQRARSEGRPITVADGDRRNPTMASFYPPGQPGGAIQPLTDETADVIDFITSGLATMASTNTSLVLDLGGGDRVLSELGRDLGLVEFCASAGASAVGLFMCGSDMDDFDHLLSVWDAGYYRPHRAIIVFNEHLVAANRTASGAFAPIMARPEFHALLKDGMVPVFMPRLPCMTVMRALGLGFIDAMAGKPGASGQALDPVRQFMVKTWHARMLTEFEKAGVLEWLP